MFKKAPMTLMTKAIPDMVLQAKGLSIEKAVPFICLTLLKLGCLFAFIMLAFTSFQTRGATNSVKTVIQSALTFGVALSVREERSPSPETEFKKEIKRTMERIFGFSLKEKDE